VDKTVRGFVTKTFFFAGTSYEKDV